ncbi:MAG TPA: class I SAM-dependent methyltransferase [Solirubrobacterales bacterium]|nr:class I SAM-dependent methyltransferase [Solirubrobacterales bacterium]
MEPTVAPSNEEEVEAWSGVLFDRWVQFRDVVAVQINPFSQEAYRICEPAPGERVLDIGCGLGETTIQLGELVGPDGEVVGIDAGERFIELARSEAPERGATNVSYEVGDVQVADLGDGFDLAFSRFGTMFCTNPVAALRNVRESLVPGGRLCMIVWRRKLDNEWLHRGELVAEQHLERPEETDEPTCGPGPFSMANADTTTDVLKHAGYERISAHRYDRDYRLGDDLDQAIEPVMAIGPAGELIRLAKDDAERMRETLEAELREAYADCVRDDGVYAPASVWIFTARAPA